VAKLYVVRHAAVTVDLNTAPVEWPLSQEGICATRQLVLSRSWSDVRHIYPMRRKTPPFRAGISGTDPAGVNPGFVAARCIA